jgi:5-methyltetrahydrofolate--homocysteine methyltransferase
MKDLNYTRAKALPAILEKRIAILDGAMGTMNCSASPAPM